MKNIFAVACLSALAQAQDFQTSCCRMPAITGCNCGCTQPSCMPQATVTKVNVCTTRMTQQNSYKQEVQTTWTTTPRQVESTVMDPVQEQKQITVMVPVKEKKTVYKTKQRPVTVVTQKTRTHYRQEMRTRMNTVTEHVQKSTLVPSSCGCYQKSCACVGTVGCGCCQPACGCAPKQTVQLTTETRQRQVPENYYESVPVQTPYTESRQHFVTEQVPCEVEVTVMKPTVQMQTVTVMKPRTVFSTVYDRIPTHKTITVNTPYDVPVKDCKDVMVTDNGLGQKSYGNASAEEIVKVQKIQQTSMEQARGKAMGTVYGSSSSWSDFKPVARSATASWSADAPSPNTRWSARRTNDSARRASMDRRGRY